MSTHNLSIYKENQKKNNNKKRMSTIKYAPY